METAYASLNSLMHLIADLREHPCPPIKIDEDQVNSLKSKISFFQEFLEGHHHNAAINAQLEIEIAGAAHAAEDLIETCITRRVRSQVDFHLSIERVIQDVDSIEKDIKEITSQRSNNQQPLPSEKNAMVDIKEIIGKLTQKDSASDNKLTREASAAAYATLTYATNTIKQFREHPLYEFHRRQADCLGSKIRFLQGHLEAGKTIIDDELMTRIFDASCQLQDFIKAHIADGVRDEVDFHDSLQGEIQERFDFVKNLLLNVEMKQQTPRNNKEPKQQTVPANTSSSQQSPSEENNVVGIEASANKIKGILSPVTKSSRKIVSISGMGGIGKTTLARKVYTDKYTKDKFDMCAWASVSKDYNTKNILLELLCCLDSRNSMESLSRESEHKLGETLYKSLYGRKYLIVLDDVWDVKVWEILRFFFPDSSGSGVLITTRELKIDGSDTFVVNLLDEGNSWNLFCKTVFERRDGCPPGLEAVGKQVSKNCGGLPLSIVVIGGHLAKSPRTREYWGSIARNLSSFMNSNAGQSCRKILSLSYTNLPLHLKPCFLYMAVFPEDKVILVSRLVRLWVAEGFLKPIKGKSLEEVAEEYLNDLVARNLILAPPSQGGKIKRCKMHDLVRDLCITEASKKDFLCVVRKLGDLGKLKNGRRRIVAHPSSSSSKKGYPYAIADVMKSQDLLRTFVIDGIMPVLENEFVRVLAPATELKNVHLPKSEVEHFSVSWRYVECPKGIWDVYLRRAIFHPWNLQYMFVAPTLEKPQPDIWEMPRLRRIKINYLILDRPPSESTVVMKNLQSAKTIINFSFCEDVVKRMPNIKKLAVRYIEGLKGFDEGAYTLNNVEGLQNLEYFRCFLDLKNVQPSHMLKNLNLPSSLKKLDMRNLCFDDVTDKFGSLPLLEVLKLCDGEGSEWTLEEGGFIKLKLLQLYDCCSLRRLKADKDYFPCLESLVLVNLDSLEEMSVDVEDTIKSIELKFCPDIAVSCAKELAAEQYDNGNKELQVKVLLLKESQLSESLTSTDNFHVQAYVGYDGV